MLGPFEFSATRRAWQVHSNVSISHALSLFHSLSRSSSPSLGHGRSIDRLLLPRLPGRRREPPEEEGSDCTGGENGECRHIGQRGHRFNHCETHAAWKVWPHGKGTRAVFVAAAPRPSGSRQIGHSSLCLVVEAATLTRDKDEGKVGKDVPLPVSAGPRHTAVPVKPARNKLSWCFQSPSLLPAATAPVIRMF